MRLGFCWLLAMFLSTLPADAASPSIPNNPKSENDCLTWSREFNAYWETFSQQARGNDMRCKAHYPGSFLLHKVYVLTPPADP